MAGRHGSGALLPVGCGARGGGLRRHAGGAVTEVCEFGPTLASRNRVPVSRSGLSDTGISCRTNLAVCRSRRWSRSPNGWAGARSVWLRLEPVLLSPDHPTSATATVPGPTRSRSRSTGHVKRSTKLPDEVSPPDWRALSVVLNDRAAIYAEEFPAVLAGVGPAMVEAFIHEEAQGPVPSARHLHVHGAPIGARTAHPPAP